MPALSLTGLASVYLGQSLANFHPDTTDAIMYWHQIRTFAAVGFSGGYYTVGEEAAAASFTHFYAWGPWYIALYGLIGKVVGWSLWSPMLFDVAAVTLALLGGLLLMRPNVGRLVLVLLVLLTYWPLHLHLPRAMQEPFHYAVAILLAGIFYRLLVHEGAVPHRFLGAALIMILGASLVRPTWILLVLPLVTVVVEKRPQGRSTRGSRFHRVFRYWPLLPACAVVAGIFLQFLYVAAPYPHPGGIRCPTPAEGSSRRSAETARRDHRAGDDLPVAGCRESRPDAAPLPGARNRPLDDRAGIQTPRP